MLRTSSRSQQSDFGTSLSTRTRYQTTRVQRVEERVERGTAGAEDEEGQPYEAACQTSHCTAKVRHPSLTALWAVSILHILLRNTLLKDIHTKRARPCPLYRWVSRCCSAVVPKDPRVFPHSFKAQTILRSVLQQLQTTVSHRSSANRPPDLHSQ